MKIIGDFHTHSTYSDGRNTIVEMVDAARARGLKIIGVTDHGPANIGTGVRSPATYLLIKEEIGQLQKKRPDIKILLGAEADITGRDGSIDIPEEIISELDYLMVGLHPYVWPKGFSDGLSFSLPNLMGMMFDGCSRWAAGINTQALVAAVNRYPVRVVTHPGLGMAVDVEKLAAACAARDAAYEINVGHNFQTVGEIKRAAECGVKFIINSDSHFTRSVGVLDSGLALLTHAQVPPAQVMNLDS